MTQLPEWPLSAGVGSSPYRNRTRQPGFGNPDPHAIGRRAFDRGTRNVECGTNDERLFRFEFRARFNQEDRSRTCVLVLPSASDFTA